MNDGASRNLGMKRKDYEIKKKKLAAINNKSSWSN